ncbi:hypothetical protein Tco_0260003, partial [Tanacetum coccineum]
EKRSQEGPAKFFNVGIKSFIRLFGIIAALIKVWICQISQENSQKRTRERMSDQEAKDLKAEAREIMPQPSTVNGKKPQSTYKASTTLCKLKGYFCY